MTRAEITTMLDTLNLPVAYDAFPKDQDLPYICFAEMPKRNFAADGIVYFSAFRYSIGFYSENRDDTTEAAIEALFDSNNIFWSKEISFIDSEQCYQVLYEIEV